MPMYTGRGSPHTPREDLQVQGGRGRAGSPERTSVHFVESGGRIWVHPSGCRRRLSGRLLEEYRRTASGCALVSELLVYRATCFAYPAPSRAQPSLWPSHAKRVVRILEPRST